MVEVIESNVNDIPLGKYTDAEFNNLLNQYSNRNIGAYPGASTNIIETSSYIYLEKNEFLKIKRY